MNEFGRFETVKKENITKYRKYGWHIIEQTEDGKFLMGLPMETGFNQMWKVAKFMFDHIDLDEFLKAVAEANGKNYADYTIVDKEEFGKIQDDDENDYYIDEKDLYITKTHEFFKMINPKNDFILVKKRNS